MVLLSGDDTETRLSLMTNADTPLLVPLTTSLYVPGTLSSSSTVLVDVGTGFFVEKSTTDAIKFYNGKVDDLTENLTEIENVVGGKSENLRIVEDGEFAVDTIWNGMLRSGFSASAESAGWAGGPDAGKEERRIKCRCQNCRYAQASLWIKELLANLSPGIIPFSGKRNPAPLPTKRSSCRTRIPTPFTTRLWNYWTV